MNVGLLATTVGGRDGVYLEMLKHAEVYRELGHKVYFISDPIHNPDIGIPHLDLEDKVIQEIFKLSNKRRLGLGPDDYLRPDLEKKLKRKIFETADTIEAALHESLGGIDFLQPHNLCLCANLPLNIAVANFLKKTGIPARYMDHDGYWHGALRIEPSCSTVENIIAEYAFPDAPNIWHTFINSLNVKHAEKLGYSALNRDNRQVNILHDTLDFDGLPDLTGMNERIREKYDIPQDALVLGFPARRVPNKAIEIGLDFYDAIVENRENLHGYALQNGQIFTEDSEIIMVFTNQGELFSNGYWNKIENIMTNRKIRYRDISEEINVGNFFKSYAIFDCVVYPPVSEGFGNQAVETWGAKKPLAMSEYPVARADILPKGFRIYSLGLSPDETIDGLYPSDHDQIRKAASEYIESILTGSWKEMVETNYNRGRQYFSNDVLKRDISEILSWAEQVRKRQNSPQPYNIRQDIFAAR
ncbi:hypothetical protein JXC34_00590 [Candidatus Woesearchaeota archaeon]|nr:hypothetical protein [Candidatus Woesearchaeota archaeon]